MSSININYDQFLELQKLGIGAFAPLTGFMTKIEFNAVVDELRLPNGAIFPLPVLLDIDNDALKMININRTVNLSFNGEIVGAIDVDDVFTCDRIYASQKIFGTADSSHPGVSHFLSMKEHFIGGQIVFFGAKTNNEIELTPTETKQLFKTKGWNKVVGFQTRNVPHRAHEYLLRIALELSDGIFIQPLVGKKKVGDFTPEAIMKGYGALIEHALPNDRIVFSTLSTLMRYAGPREAVFHAIIRRNYGCTDFIVGRDHAGVGGWYGLYDAHKLTAELEPDLGINILRLKGPYYCKACDSIATSNSCNHGEDDIEQISGTYMRKVLSGGGIPDKHLMRAEVVNALIGLDCFIK